MKMNKTDLLKQIARAITKAAKNVDPKVKVAASKAVSALAGAKLVDDTILDNIPGLKSAMIWTDEKISQGQQWLLDNTLGKIPGVGPIISKLHKGGTELRYKVRDALLGANNPQWYEHLPQHVPFTVPGSYNNKTVKFITGNGSKTAIPSVATINLLRNIVTTPYATTSRYSEIYTAVKYARGLSYLPYTVNHLALTYEIGNELTVLYYRITKAVAAAFHYSLTKANLPKQILVGLNFTDIIDNYADYVTLLDQMYNFMSVNTPLLPIMHDKLRQMCLFTALDSEKPAMSTYIQAYVMSNSIHLAEDKERFYSDNVTPTRDILECRNLFKYYVDLLMNASDGSTSQLLNVIADIKGSIASTVYVENWRSIKFDNTFTSDKLFLNSIKNMDLLPTFGLVGKSQNSDAGFVCDHFEAASQGTYSSPIDIARGQSQSVIVRMASDNTAGSTGLEPKYICCSGSKELKPFAVQATGSTPQAIDLTQDEYRFTNRLVSLDGTEDGEGKYLEILSLSSLSTRCELELPTDTTRCFVNITVDPSLFIGLDVNVDNGYGEGEVKTLRNVLGIPGWFINDFIYGPVTTWSLIDWMPAIRLTYFASFAQYYTAQMWDVNGLGSLSYKSMETAIDYITYSLLYPGNVEALNKIELANKLISSLKSK